MRVSPELNNLWLKYFLAFGSIGILGFAYLLTANSYFTRSEKMAAYINVSGQQRMLSQRITLFSNEMVFSNWDKEKISARIQLGETLDQFTQAHRVLTDPTTPNSLAINMPASVRRLYFDRPHNVDELSRTFIREARTILDGSTEESEMSVHRINAVAPFKLLDALNEVTSEYERLAYEGARWNSNIATSVFVLTLLVLAVIGRFVILPTQRAVVGAMQSLRESLAESEYNRCLLEATFEQIEQGLVVYDADLRLVNWSRSFEKILRLPKGWAVKGRSIEDYFRLNAERGDYGDISTGDIESVVRERMEELRIDRRSIKPHRYVRQTAFGRYIEIIGNPMPGGGMVTTYSDITQQEEAKQEIEKLAWTDTLTGLLNRNAMNGQLAVTLSDAKAQSMKVAFLLLDLDRFKPINDTYGHAAGDVVLQIVAQRIRQAIGPDNKAFRLGGDEFAMTVLYDDIKHVRDIIGVLTCSVRDPIDFEGRELTVTATVGVATYPEQETDPVELIRKADTALYEAKDNGRGGFRFYDKHVDRKARKLRWIEDELSRAIKDHEFELHFQPKVRASDASIVGAEALIRWQHPRRGLVPPGEFIPVAERTDLVFPMGEWVLREAWNRVPEWVNKAPSSEFTVAVNVSPRQFFDIGFRNLLKELADSDPDRTRHIELEITEEVMIGNVEQAKAILRTVDAMNYAISIDDFGTGYSSISYLHKLPVSKIKIDRSFIVGLGKTDRAEHVMRSIVDLGHNLGLTIIAEGVETETQARILQRSRCDEFQGYLFGRPVLPEEFEAQLVRSVNAPASLALAS